MRFTLLALTALLALVTASAQAARSAHVFVHHRPFTDHFTAGDTVYVEVESILKAMGFAWEVQGDRVRLTPEGASPAIEVNSFEIVHEGDSARFDALRRGEDRYVPLRPLAEFLGYSLVVNRQTGIVDVLKARRITEHDRRVAEEVARRKAQREREIQEAWHRKRAEIQARRQEEKEKQKAAEQGAEGSPAPGAGGGPPPAGEGAPPAQRSGSSAGTGVGEAPGAEPAGPPEGSPSAGAAAPPGGEKPAEAPSGGEKPAEAPSGEGQPKEEKPPPQARLIVIRPLAVPDYFTGEVKMTAEIRNNGYATARDIRAHLTLKGPDGQVWNRRTLYRDALPEDGVWNLEARWTHLSGNSMPRGVPTLQVELDYRKN